MWQQWINFVLGLWLAVSAYTGMTLAGLTLNLTVTGIVIAGLALWGALKHQSMERGEHHRMRTT